MSLHLTIFAITFYFAFLVRGVMSPFLGFVMMSKISAVQARALTLICHMLSVILIQCFAFVFGGNPAITFLIVFLFLLGLEFHQHAKLRTTASYSTSDSQNQRLFNLTLFATLLGSLFALLLHGIRANPFFFISFESLNWPTQLWLQALLVLGLLGMARFLISFFQNLRTLIYLLGNYAQALREGKMKRFW